MIQTGCVANTTDRYHTSLVVTFACMAAAAAVAAAWTLAWTAVAISTGLAAACSWAAIAATSVN